MPVRVGDAVRVRLRALPLEPDSADTLECSTGMIRAVSGRWEEVVCGGDRESTDRVSARGRDEAVAVGGSGSCSSPSTVGVGVVVGVGECVS